MDVCRAVGPRALFGLNCCGTRSPINDTTEVPPGLLAGGDSPDLNPSTGAVLSDTVVRLQMEIEELRSDSMCNQTGGTQTPLQRSRWTTVTSTKVPKFAGVTNGTTPRLPSSCYLIWRVMP